MTDEWEFKFLVMPINTTGPEAEKLCNELGQAGWEMCSGKAAFWFQRRIEDWKESHND